MKKYTLFSLIITIFGVISSVLFIFFGLQNLESERDVKPLELTLTQENEKSKIAPPLENYAVTNEKLTPQSVHPTQVDQLPEHVLNSAPFISQAPLGVWDDIHQEACEEASLIIANAYVNDTKHISKEVAENKIQNLVAWQKKKFGKFEDTNANEMQIIANEYFQQDTEITEEITLDFFKEALANKKIIIIPVAGRDINNPNFTPPGPLYHVLVITGYDETTKEFITHDPGTRRGENFRYPYQKLLNNIHDFPGDKKQINQGTPRALIISKK